jgi:hypothetical protein
MLLARGASVSGRGGAEAIYFTAREGDEEMFFKLEMQGAPYPNKLELLATVIIFTRQR